MHSAFRKVLGIAGVLLFMLPAFAADSADQEAYGKFKESYEGFKGVYEKTKSTVDSTAEFFGKFNNAVSTWRNAVSAEFQDAGIEGITELTKEQMGAIDAAAEKLSELTGISIPENVPEKIKTKLSAKLLGSLPADKQRKYGYMYTLSSLDRKMRDSGTYERLAAVKEQFEAGSELLGNVDKAVEFMDTFNPKTDGSVTGSLKKIKGVLDYMGGFTEEIPLMGTIIKGYADVTDGFVGALEDLDKKLKDSRQGSLGGQLGVDAAVKRKILSEYPGIEGEMTLYFSINGEYPELKPIRGWKNEQVLLYYGDDDGSGSVALLNAGSFDTMYKYYAALKKSALEPVRKMADPETFMNRARAVGDKSIADHDRRFREYYARFEGSNSYDLVRALETAGKKNSDGFLVSEAGRVIEYRLYTRREDEFAGLCFFNQQFRNEVEELLAKYGDLRAVTVTVKTKDGRKLEGLEATANGAAVARLTAKPSGAEFSFIVKKQEPYTVGVKATGMKPWSRGGLTDPYLTVELEADGESAGGIRIISPDTVEERTAFTFSADLGTTTLKAVDEVQWIVDGSFVGKGMSWSFTPEYLKPLTIKAQIIYRSGRNGYERGPAVEKTVTVVAPKETGVAMRFEAPKDVLVGLEQLNLKVVAEGSKVMTRAISYGLREETTGTVIRAPSSWSSKYQPGWKDELQERFKVPKAPCTLRFVAELWQYQQGSTTAVVASAAHEVTVHSLGLKVPGAVTAMEKFTAGVAIPGEIQSQVKQIGWSPYDAIISGSDWGKTTTQQVTMQLRNDQVRQDGTVEFAAYALNQKGDVIGIESLKVPARPVNMGTTVPGSWEGGPVEFRRKPAQRMRSENGKDVKSAEVSGWLKIAVDRPGSVFYKPDTEQQAIKEWASQHGAQVRKIEISGFEGSIAEQPVWSRYGGNPWGYVDVGTVKAGAAGKGLLFNGAYIMTIDYTVDGGGLTLGTGTPWWDDMPFAVQQAEQINGEIQGMIAGYKISPDASMTKGGDKEPAKQPKVTLSASRTKLRKGETATVTVAVENAAAADEPFNYSWNGNYSGKGQSVTFMATAGGKQTLSVAVKGARYGLGSASIEFAVEETKVAITKTSPAGNQVTVGSPAAFSAAVTTAGGQTPAALVYRWEPHPEVAFDPHEGAGNKTTAKFMKPGKVKVWVEVLEKKGEVLSTLGSSDQIELDVVKPALKLALSKTAPLAGEEITAKVDAGPETKTMDFRWVLSNNAKLVRESKDATEIVFYLTDAKEAKVTVNARVPHSGDDLGSAEARLTAKPYTIKAEVLGPLGPKPMVWKEGQGLVEDKAAIKTGQNVRLKATVSPAPRDKVSYSWKTNSGTGFGGGSFSDEAMLTRSEKGTAEGTVEVKNADGVLLGTAKASFEVTVSDDDERKAKDKAEKDKRKKEAAGLLTKARALMAQGKLEDALALAEQAAKTDPDGTEAPALVKELKAKIKERDAKKNDVGKDKDAAKDKDGGKKTDGKSGSADKSADKGTGGAAGGARAGTGADGSAGKPTSSADDVNYQAETRATEAEGYYQQYRTASMHGGTIETMIDLLTKSIDKLDESLEIRDSAHYRKVREERVKLRDSYVQTLKNIERAKDLRKEADSLAQSKKIRDWKEAKAKYDESVKLYQPPDWQILSGVIYNLDVKIKNTEAEELRGEGDSLLKDRKLVEAVAKYDQALAAYHPTYPFRQNFEVKIQEVRNKITGGRSWRKQGEGEEKRGELDRAVKSYETSLGLLPDEELADHVAELKKRLAKTAAADALRAEGDALAKKGDLAGAIKKYEKAVDAYGPDHPAAKKLETLVQTLRGKIDSARDLRKQGEAEEKRGETAKAVKSYRASLALVPDEDLANHVAAIAAGLKQTAAKPAETPAAAASSADGEAAVRQLYQDFARAYESKNESRVMNFIASDWDAGDGTSLSDLRNYLHNSFGVFDEIRYVITGLTVKKLGSGRYRASYTVKITGRIFENDIRHEERSSIDETVIVDARGRARIAKTADGKFWVVE